MCEWRITLTRRTATHPLAPRPISSLNAPSLRDLSCVAPRDLWLPHQPQKRLFENDSEYSSFKTFAEKTSHQISGCFPSELWSYIVLQSSEIDPGVRNAVIALGALNVTSYDAITAAQYNLGIKAPDSVKAAEHRRRFALQYYDKALKQMGQAEAAGPQSLRSRLISLILTAVFETYHGNHEYATLQLHIGRQMIVLSMTQTKTPDSRFAPGSLALDTAIDADLIQAFGRLDTQLGVVRLQPACMPSREFFKQYELPILERMTPKFSSIREARYSLDQLIRCMLNEAIPDAPSKPSTARLQTYITHKKKGKPDIVISKDSVPFVIAKADAPRVHLFMERWKIAFEASKLLTGPVILPVSKDYLAGAALKLLYLATRIRIAAELERTQVGLDKYLAIYIEMVTLGDILVNNAGPERFTFDSVYVVPIYIVSR